MENVLNLSIEEQNSYSQSAFDLAISESINYAKESNENIADYFLRDFDESPENWNSVFEYAYDEISSKAKQERRKILVGILVFEGYIPTEE
jgi:hypothetical protein